MFKIFKTISKFFASINETNSNMAVQCDAKYVCRHRHTQLCDTCEHNCGWKEDEDCYKPIK